MPTNTRLRRTLALLLAGGSLAIGVPAAIAAGGGDDAAGSGANAPSSGLIQDEQQPRERPDRDCPERDGDDGNGNGGGGSEDSGSNSTQAL